MLKPGLGKSLGDLMQGDQVAGSKPVLNEAPAAPTDFGRGMKTLIRAETPPERATETRPILPPWFFFAADLVLLAFTVAVTLDAPRPLDFGHVLFSGVSVTLGALLATCGVLQVTARK